MAQHTLKETLRGMQTGLFASRGSIQEALQYAYDLIGAMPSEARAPAFTALHVVLNTVSKELTKLIEEEHGQG